MNLLEKLKNRVALVAPPQYKLSNWALVAVLYSSLMLMTPSCKVKEGCPTKDYTNTMEKTNKHGKSNLFDKSMRKKMKH